MTWMKSTKRYLLKIGEIEVEVVKKDIKNVHLAVYPPSGRVRMATPLGMEEASIRLYAIAKLGWIKKQQKKIRLQERENRREYITGETHYYKGGSYLLNVIYEDAPPKVVMRNKKYIELHVRPGAGKHKREEVLRAWYREQLKAEVPALLEKWEQKIGVKAEDWGIRQMRTKWGSCSIEARRIWLNLELAKKPTICLEYIIAHELVHLLERHHNARFIALMDRCMPHWRRYKAALNSLPVRHEEWGY